MSGQVPSAPPYPPWPIEPPVTSRFPTHDSKGYVLNYQPHGTGWVQWVYDDVLDPVSWGSMDCIDCGQEDCRHPFVCGDLVAYEYYDCRSPTLFCTPPMWYILEKLPTRSSDNE